MNEGTSLQTFSNKNIRGLYGQLYTNKLDSLEERDKYIN